ncbi:ABC transporter ATP-binding protein [Alloiococcus sp. CFN-8]|uniref:ABC transporter ATP-binding protein n=1 Tax=Alloiococcus sp. CFN-8 TaxID=3416081 RepID=UPI003CE6F692
METLKKFISYYKPHKKLFFIDMLSAFTVALCDLFYPMIARNIINDYVPNKNLRLLLVWVVVLFFIYVLKSALSWVIQYYGHIVGVRMQGDMRRDVFKRLQKLPFSFFDENKTGSIMSRIINDLMDISELAHHGPEDLFISLISLIGSFIILSSINLPLTIIIFACLPPIVIFSMKMRGRMSDAFTKTREEIAEVNAGLENSIAGIRVSRAYNNSNFEEEKFEGYNESFKKARAAAYKVMAHFSAGMSFSMDILYLVVLVGGGLFYYNGVIDVGDFAMYILFISMFLNPIKRLVAFYEQLQNGMTGFKRFEELMAVQEEPEAPGAIEVDNLSGVIDFKNVYFRYEGKKTQEEDSDDGLVLNNLNLHVDQGKTIALVGPSGGGKTTLCHLIPRFYEISSGSISIDGYDIRELTRSSLRKNIGIVAQDVFLFTGTIRENILYGNLEASEEEIIAAAKKARIHDFIMSLEDGYDTYIGERGVKLSGGQKQRLSIARVFLKNPSILILDEATSALDNATEMAIQESLEELARGRTCIIVAHRLSTIKNADEIIVLTDEGIKEVGNHQSLLEKKGIYSTLYQYQFKAIS